MEICRVLVGFMSIFVRVNEGEAVVLFFWTFNIDFHYIIGICRFKSVVNLFKSYLRLY